MSASKVIVTALAGLAIVASIAGFATVLKRSQGENLVNQIGIDQNLNGQVPMDATFKDETGKDVTIGSLIKRPTVLMLIFYRCVDVSGTCYLELEGATKAFSSMQKDTIGRDYDVVTLSIHPKETFELAAAKKAQFLKSYNRPEAVAGWHFLTGSQDQINRVASAVGFRYKYDEAKDRIVHPTGLVILSPEGRISKYFYGADFPAKILRDSIVAAGRGTIGDQSTPILLGCFMYDESTGRTRLNVVNALKVTGTATVLILFGSILIMTLKARKGSY